MAKRKRHKKRSDNVLSLASWDRIWKRSQISRWNSYVEKTSDKTAFPGDSLLKYSQELGISVKSCSDKDL